jgi:glycosyltransferase involved in cell wall biosynthesis
VASFSIIVPSYNQDKFIKETLENLASLKSAAGKKNIGIQIIVADNCSEKTTLDIINSYELIIDNLFIEKDSGQYDAINKGLNVVAGDYWTWLNTDDLIDIDGFFKIADYLESHKNTDYIYGDIAYIDEHSKFHKDSSTGELSFDKLISRDASISQPGSFFRTAFTNKIGKLAPYHFAFDYEYILRCLKNNAVVARLDSNVAFFRYYTTSKSGSKDYRFLKEQLVINRLYGGKSFSKLSILLHLRILKRKLFN